jgi:replicative DNA helicase
VSTYEIHDNALGMLLSSHRRYWPVAKQHGFRPEIFDEIQRVKIARAIEKVSEIDDVDFNHTMVIDILGGEYAPLVRSLIRNAPIEMNFGYFISQLVLLHKIKNIEPDVMNILHEMKACRASLSMAHVLTKISDLADKANGMRPASSSAKDLVNEVIPSAHEQNLEILEKKSDGDAAGISTGYEKIDLHLGAGMQRGGLYIIAARTSVGKTTFATSIFGNVVQSGYAAGYFTNEMPAEDIVNKLISREGRLNSVKLLNGDWDSPDDQRSYYNGLELMQNVDGMGWIDERSGWCLDQLISVVHQKAYEKKCDVVVVDYIQQVRVRGAETKHVQVSRVSEDLKKMARDLNVVVIALAQLSREAEKADEESGPGLHHLKDSGSIEQDADGVIILHKKKLSDPDVVAKILKSRKGRIGDVKLTHFLPFNLYEEA